MTTTFALGSACKHGGKRYPKRIQFYSHQGQQLVCNHLLYVCRILLHHSVAFTHLKLVGLTFWQDKSFVRALLHREKKNLDTEFFAQMPASASRRMVYFVKPLSDSLLLAHAF